MGWLIELLVEGMREKCSQFIVDMMDVVTEVFMELLSCDLDPKIPLNYTQVIR